MISRSNTIPSEAIERNYSTRALALPDGDHMALDLNRACMPITERRALLSGGTSQEAATETDISQRAQFTRSEVAAVLKFAIDHPDIFPPDVLEHIGVSVVANAANQASVLSSSEFKDHLAKNPGLAIFLDVFIDRIGIIQGRRWVPDKDIREAIQMAKLHDYEEKARGKFRRIVDILLCKDKLKVTALAEKLESMYAESLALDRENDRLRAIQAQLKQQIELETSAVRREEEQKIDLLREEQINLRSENQTLKEQISENRILYDLEKSRHHLELQEQKITGRKLYAQELEVYENRKAALIAELRDLELNVNEKRSELGLELDTERYKVKEEQELTRMLQAYWLESETCRSSRSFDLRYLLGLAEKSFIPALLAYENRYGSDERARFMTGLLSDLVNDTGHVIVDFQSSRFNSEKYRLEWSDKYAFKILLWLIYPSTSCEKWLTAFTETFEWVGSSSTEKLARSFDDRMRRINKN